MQERQNRGDPYLGPFPAEDANICPGVDSGERAKWVGGSGSTVSRDGCDAYGPPRFEDIRTDPSVHFLFRGLNVNPGTVTESCR